MMKIVFLDVDGVLNSNAWYVARSESKTIKKSDLHEHYPFYEFDPSAIENLNLITDSTGAKIVVSSTWRLGRSIEDLRLLFDRVGITGEVIGKTPSFTVREGGYTIPRGCEIQKWLSEKQFVRINYSREAMLEQLKKSEVSNYVILDDDSDMLYCQREHFFKANFMVGLTKELAERCIEFLSKDLIEVYYDQNK